MSIKLLYWLVSPLTFIATLVVPAVILASVSANKEDYPHMTKFFTTRDDDIIKLHDYLGIVNLVLICFLLGFTPYLNFVVLCCVLSLASTNRCEKFLAYLEGVAKEDD